MFSVQHVDQIGVESGDKYGSFNTIALQVTLWRDEVRSLSRLLLQSLRSPQTQEHATFKEGFEKVKAQACRMAIQECASRGHRVNVGFIRPCSSHPERWLYRLHVKTLRFILAVSVSAALHGHKQNSIFLSIALNSVSPRELFSSLVLA